MLLYFVVLWIKKTFYSLPKLYFLNYFLKVETKTVLSHKAFLLYE